jgi:hypothetical protein
MRLSICIMAVVCGAVTGLQNLIAQPVSTAVPGLSLTTSARGNGMGGIAATLPSSDASGTIANPGQLGVFGLDNLFSASTYSPKTDWIPGGFFGNHSITVSALNAGINLQDMLSLPFSAGIGIGYSRTLFGFEAFSLYDSSGSQVGGQMGNETYENYSIGLGLEYVVRLGIGVNFKKISSRLSTFGLAPGPAEATATPSATDFGVLLNIPIVGIVSKLSRTPPGAVSGMKPFVDLSVGYVKSNIGEVVKYTDPTQGGPLPRTATLGLGVEAGISAMAGKTNWRMISLSLARQAEDILVTSHDDGTFTYKGGVGDISIGENFFVGGVTGNVLVRTGLELGAAEFLYIRVGSVKGNFYDYSTSGYSVCLGGLIRLLQYASPEIAGTTWLAFIGDHFDLQYQSASYRSAEDPLDGITFRELNLVVRGMPW